MLSFLKTIKFSQVESYDPSLDSWTTTTSMIEHRSSLGVCILDGFLYALGGYNGQTTLNSVEKFNPLTQEWSMVTAMNTRRSMLGVGSLNGILYAVGKKLEYCYVTPQVQTKKSEIS